MTTIPPPPPAVPRVPRAVLAADALNRVWRTCLQGIVAAALIGAAAAIHDALTAGRTDYRAIGYAGITAAVMAGLAAVQRYWLDPSRLPSAAPPSDALLQVTGTAQQPR